MSMSQPDPCITLPKIHLTRSHVRQLPVKILNFRYSQISSLLIPPRFLQPPSFCRFLASSYLFFHRRFLNNKIIHIFDRGSPSVFGSFGWRFAVTPPRLQLLLRRQLPGGRARTALYSEQEDLAPDQEHLHPRQHHNLAK